MKNTCVDCQFLSKGRSPFVSHEVTKPKPWNLIERGNKRVPYVMKHYGNLEFVGCFQNYWIEYTDSPKKYLESREKIGREVTIDRKDDCFFYPFRENMVPEAADVLQKRNTLNAQLKRSHLYTQIGLYIAGGALVADLLLTHWSSIVNGLTSVLATWHNWMNDIVVFYALIKGIL